MKIRRMEDLNVAIRLKGFIEAEGLTNSQFADLCGIPRPSLSQLLSGRNKKISDVLVGQIHRAFPKLSILWLLFDEGEMLVTDHASTSDSPLGAPEFDLNYGDPAADSGFAPSNLDNALGVRKLTFENSNFPPGGQQENKYENLRALNGGENSAKVIDSKCIALEKQIADLQSQIDKFVKNPRKVSQITVYYDDNTFETFYPSSKKS